MKISTALAGTAMLVVAAAGVAAQGKKHGGGHDAPKAPPTTACGIAGPQSPRDLGKPGGINKDKFALAPSSGQMNLCNIHFHKGAEHLGPGENGFHILAKKQDGYEGGYRCQLRATPEELKPIAASAAKGCEHVRPGDTIEVHWVFSTCDVAPGPGLGSCVKAGSTCQLRVESQVFLLVNSSAGDQFQNYGYAGRPSGAGKHQPKGLPSGQSTVSYRGSTTNPAYDSEDACSPLAVTWNVRSSCNKLDISSLHRWCADNSFGESHGHDPRQLVTDLKLLSEIE